MSGAARARIAIVGSINVDLTARTTRLPGRGETVGGGVLQRGPGGKGANQAAAAARLGADTRMIGAVGRDENGRWMLETLGAAGVDTADVSVVESTDTGTALIVVDDDGENQIAVCEGANAVVSLAGVDFASNEAVLTQLELSMDVVLELSRQVRGFFAVNIAPAGDLPPEVIERADLIIANESEYELTPAVAGARLLAVTYGSQGASMFRYGTRVASAPARSATVVNTVGAGDAFCAALVLSLLGGASDENALAVACSVGAAAVEADGAQPEFRRLDEYS